MADLALLQYNYSDSHTIVRYSTAASQVQDALNYLLSVNVLVVNALPESPSGYFCIRDSDIYKVYNCYVDGVSGVVIQDLMYCLRYIPHPS
jgi:hypothetical protein